MKLCHRGGNIVKNIADVELTECTERERTNIT